MSLLRSCCHQQVRLRGDGCRRYQRHLPSGYGLPRQHESTVSYPGVQGAEAWLFLLSELLPTHTFKRLESVGGRMSATTDDRRTCDACGEPITDDDKAVTERSNNVGNPKQSYHLECYTD